MGQYVINKIIEKAEKSTVDWQKEAAGNRSFPLKDYHEKDYLKIGRSDFAKEVRELELDGLLKCSWYERYSEIREIKYKLENLTELYLRAGRREKYTRINLLSDYVAGLWRTAKKGWIRTIYLDMLERLREGKIPGELKAVDDCLQNTVCFVDNWAVTLADCGKLDIFLILKGLDEIEEPIFKRLLSSRYLRDRIVNGKTIKASKVFENCCQSAVISLAKQYHPFVDESMDTTQILSQLYIEEYAQELAVKGPLVIELDGREISLENFIYGTVLNSQTLKYGTPAAVQRIKNVITVENKANYEVIPYDKETIILYSHGYFTPREREFLIKLHKNMENHAVRYYHTGDLDYGGICIFQYIRRQIFPEIRPLYMNALQYERYKENAEEMESTAIEKLRKIEEPLLQPLIECLLEEGKGIEQENFVSDYATIIDIVRSSSNGKQRR